MDYTPFRGKRSRSFHLLFPFPATRPIRSRQIIPGFPTTEDTQMILRILAVMDTSRERKFERRRHFNSTSRFWYCRVYSGTTESILVLQNRFWYYRVDFGTAESIVVLRSRFRYYRFDVGTTESILVLQSRFRYYRGDLCTTESISVLQDRSWY